MRHLHADPVGSIDHSAAPASHSVAAGDAGGTAEDGLYRAISSSLLQGRLRPGTPLRERYLAEEFGVTRGLVRRVLSRLGQEGKLELHANRGAFVPQPTRDQVLDAYETRKALEAGMLMLLAASITPAQISRLRAHLEAERRASLLARRDESVRLAGGFHLLIADLLDNARLQELLKLLVAQTQMYVALFEPAQASGCAPDEHEPIVEALARGDASGAVHALLDHLTQVEQRVLSHLSHGQTPVADILRSALGRNP
ncbi:MAG: GntR family transcriptional regulator [Proteobacteria bacterium]|nr:GntR family transcriptional regulator [Pseudomonadota bacterium]